ncbi:MAG: exo-alpha-sialidase [Gemmatimonadaceae bacterium]|nr:exo-alpha-sialidase [Gemmatimonadaceae bacterium]
MACTAAGALNIRAAAIASVLAWSLTACAHQPSPAAAPSTTPPVVASLLDTRAALGVPTVDLAADTARQTVVDKESGQYLGHPTTVLLEDGRTMLVVYPRGHGAGAIQLKRSTDGGRTWSARLAVPENWATSKETPTIHRVVDRQGVKRLVLFSGLYPIRMSVSSDDGEHWSALEPIGDFGGIVAMASVERLNNGDYLALFHDDGRFIANSGKKSGPFVVYKTLSHDGGLHWDAPIAIASRPDIDLCEPGLFRSPDGKRLMVLLRENRRALPSHRITSDDEGVTWSAPVPLSPALTGDRHVATYLPDGRLFVTFRDMAPESPTKGDWVAWVGTYDELLRSSSAGFRVRLMDNTDQWDAAYPGLVRLPDGSVVTTTYGHWTAGQPPWIASIRLQPAVLDRTLRHLLPNR